MYLERGSPGLLKGAGGGAPASKGHCCLPCSKVRRGCRAWLSALGSVSLLPTASLPSSSSGAKRGRRRSGLCQTPTAAETPVKAALSRNREQMMRGTHPTCCICLWSNPGEFRSPLLGKFFPSGGAGRSPSIYSVILPLLVYVASIRSAPPACRL